MFDGFFFLSDMPMAVASTVARYNGSTDAFFWLVDEHEWWKISFPFVHAANFIIQLYLMITT